MTVSHRAVHPGQVEIDALREELVSTEMPQSLVSFCAEQAQAYGNTTAIDYFQLGIRLSYRDIHIRSNRIAANLLAHGYRKGAHVAVMLPNSPASVLVWFAIMKIGAVIVPVNTAYGGKELDYLINQSDAQALIIHEGLLPALEDMRARPDLLGIPFVIGDADAGSLEEGAELDHFDPGYPIVATDLANLQYTSGTTGFPKGCMLTQDYWLLLSHSIAAMHRSYGSSRLFFWAPFFYMDGQWSFLSAMAVGGTAIIASRMSLTNFLDWLREHEAHYCVLPEPILKKLPSAPGDASLPVKFAHTFGWRPSAREEAENRFGLVARDGFGMTEVGPAMICPKAAGEKLVSNTCGLAAPFRQTRVVDELGNECPPGVPGELQIRGRAIMLGYYKRPDANAQSFDGDWLRTGDLFIKDEDGYHRIVGRLKEMIKRAGENISASEVEAAMREAPQIAEAAAIAVPDEVRREEVMLLVKLADGVDQMEMTPQSVAEHAACLAAFKRPRYLAYVREFPRTPTNKIAKSRIGLDDLDSAVFDLSSMLELSASEAGRLIGK
jgi:acyl-CoA synthetase (AMP-forming)/AMP-acid ligase II